MVDDCDRVRATVVDMLEHYGATVTAVATADAALEALVRERPDVLVSDLVMPDKGGYWLIREVRALAPGVAAPGREPPREPVAALVGHRRRRSRGTPGARAPTLCAASAVATAVTVAP